MFSCSELLNMDVRDMAFWLRAARRKMLFDQLRSIQAVRAGMASNEEYTMHIQELQSQINGVDKKDVVNQNWEDLKLRRRG